MKECLKKSLCEFIGTFFLVFTVGCTLLFGGNGVIPALAIGSILMVMVYAGAKISGGHYNPAVSMAVSMNGALNFKHLICYWISQFLAAAGAGFLIRYLASYPSASDGCTYLIMPLVIAEFLFTFALCYVVLLTAVSKRVENNSYFGLAIGATVAAGAFAVGGILCTGAFNPAVALSLIFMGICNMKIVSITALTNLLAGIAAALIYKLVEIRKEQF